MASKIKVKLDVLENKNISTQCKQNDDLVLEASIYEGSKELDLTNSYIIIQARKSDLNPIVQDVNIVKSRNTIIAELDREFTKVPGLTIIEIVMIEKGKQNTTFSFSLLVEKSVINIVAESKILITPLERLQNTIIEAKENNEIVKTTINSAKENNEALTNTVNAAVAANVKAEENINNLNLKNTAADTNVSTLTLKNTKAEENIIAIETKNTEAVTNIAELEIKIAAAGEVKAETEQLIATGGAATKGDIAKVNSSLEQKLNKNGIVTMSNMGQDVKEAMTGGSVAVVGRNAILAENIVNEQVTTEKVDFLKYGYVEKYNKNNSVAGGLNGDGTDGNNQDYSRTEYIPINNDLSGNGVTIFIIDMTNTIKTDYVFLYPEKSQQNALKIGPLVKNNGAYSYTVSGDYKYLRFLDKTATWGDVRDSVKVFVKGKPNGEILKKFNLDEKFVESENINVKSNNLFDGISITGGLTWSGSDDSNSSFGRSNYIKIKPNSKYKFKTNNLNMTSHFIFGYINKGDQIGIKIEDTSEISNGEFTFITPHCCNYIRFVTVSATKGSYLDGLSISEVGSNIEDTVIINNMNFEKRYSKVNKLERPSSGKVNFKVKINGNLIHEGDSLSKVDNYVELEDDCVLFLPKNYTENGKATRLIINCHGAGTTISNNTSSLTMPVDYFVNGLGYAVLDVNGVPKSLSNNSGLHYGSPLALQSYLKAYHYVIENYNIKEDGCFVCGTSMGGLSSFMLVQSGSIPVLAQAGICPVVDHFKQAYCNPWNEAVSQRSQIAKLFGFTGSEPQWTSSKYPSDEEIKYYMDNIDKIIGYNPIMKGTINWNEINPYLLKVNSEEEKEGYNKLIKYHHVPLKIWHNDNDSTVLQRYSEFLVNSIRNAGGLAYLRKFPSGEHNAWDNGENVITTTFDGGSYTVKTSGYEIGLWFKRFDK